MPIPLSAISPCDNGPALNLTLLLAIPHIKILEAGGGDICSRNVLSDGAGGISGAADGANPAKTCARTGSQHPAETAEGGICLADSTGLGNGNELGECRPAAQKAQGSARVGGH
jgi:hypothetical protein